MEARTSPLPAPDEKHGYVRTMFDAIAPRYDLLNGLLSLNLHHHWRRIAADRTQLGAGDSALDVCTGTGDFAIELARRVGPDGRVVGTDYSEGMLAFGQPKTADIPQLSLQWADTQELPFPDESFDAVTVGFGIRNVADIQRGLSEMARVLKPGGRLVILEFTQPQNRLIAWGYGLYGKLMPVLGGLLSARRDAYAYLPESVAAFHTRESLAALLSQTGLENISITDLNLGTVAIHVATRPWVQ
jgi:demethylmenaquinone methyltransferase/2-methoxy-6-polyprenyl-1,4-benzoquinol methylase